MKKQMCLALIAAAGMAPAAMAANVSIDPGSANWLGFMNVFDLGGNFVFGSGWGVGDLVAQFDDVNNTLTMLPNQIGDPNEFWYQDPTGSGNTNPGGPGAPGNKIMEANLYQQVDGGALSGQTVTFSGMLLSNTFTPAHEVRVFIRDFANDFSSVNEQIVQLNAPGAFSISLDTIADSSRFVQWGIQVKGVNVWSTDIDPFGSAVFATIPAPGAAALMGLGGLLAARRRR